jgi:hypothetical protein
MSGGKNAIAAIPKPLQGHSGWEKRRGYRYFGFPASSDSITVEGFRLKNTQVLSLLCDFRRIRFISSSFLACKSSRNRFGKCRRI